MLIWAMFLAGYFLGVFTALAIFPPQVKEIEEQEWLATEKPILLEFFETSDSWANFTQLVRPNHGNNASKIDQRQLSNPNVALSR